MLLAYIDEVGEAGAFVSREHKKFNTSPAFGYAGFILPAKNARAFSQYFTHEKRTLFSDAYKRAENQGRWEVKGSDVFRPNTYKQFPENIRVFRGLVSSLRRHKGQLFYYVREKPIGTPKQTTLDLSERQRQAMFETLNRIARFADSQNDEVLVLFDGVNENQRLEQLGSAYAHIYSRAAEYPEMSRLVEPPMHVDSAYSSNVQFADWVAALVNRAVDWQLIPDSRYEWVTMEESTKGVFGSFTYESKLALEDARGLSDLNRSEILKKDRPVLHPNGSGSIGSRIGIANALRIKAAAERAAQKDH